MLHRHRHRYFWLAFAATAACSGPAPEEGATRRDSAGVAIVENDPATVPRLGVGASPVVDIGAGDGGDGEILFDVIDARWLSDGRLAVAVSGDSEVRIYDATGSRTRSLGGEGDGPGEFRAISTLGVRGDSLLVVDQRLLKIAVYGPDGTLAREITEKHPWIGVADDGRPWSIAYMFRDPPPDGLYSERAAIVSHDMTGSPLDTVAVVDLFEVYSVVGEGRWAPLFARSTEWAFGPGRVAVADNAATRVSVYSPDGTLVRLIGRRWTHRPVSDADVESLIEWRLAADAFDRRAVLEPAYRGLPVPETMPAFGRTDPSIPGLRGVLVTPERIWIKEYDAPPLEPPVWSVFDSVGVLQAIVELPLGFELTDALADRVVGRWRDELDVERVRVFELEREP